MATSPTLLLALGLLLAFVHGAGASAFVPQLPTRPLSEAPLPAPMLHPTAPSLLLPKTRSLASDIISIGLRAPKDDKNKLQTNLKAPNLRPSGSYTLGNLPSAILPPIQADPVQATASSVGLPEARRSPSPTRGPKPVGIFLDIDHTCIYGNDANDLWNPIQEHGGSQEQLQGLYARVINPKVVELIESIRAAGTFDEVRVCLYTRRTVFLDGHSEGSPPITYGAWHQGTRQFCVPSTVTSSEEIMEACDARGILSVKDAWSHEGACARLLATRDALVSALKLDYVPDVVVCKGDKDVAFTAKVLGLDPEETMLWDDNTDLEGNAAVVMVDKCESMPAAQRKEALEYIESIFPARDQKPEDIGWFFEGHPADQCIRELPDGSFVYHIEEETSPARAFNIPLRFRSRSSDSSCATSSPPPESVEST